MLTQFQSDDRVFQMMQSSWASDLNPVISNPITQGIILNNVALVNGTTTVNHLLSRKLQGWILIGVNAAATIYDAQATNQNPTQTLILISNAACLVNLYVF